MFKEKYRYPYTLSKFDSYVPLNTKDQIEPVFSEIRQTM